VQTRQQDLTTALEIIEQACREQPYCAACGQPNRPIARGDVVSLECPSWTEGRSRLARIVSFQAGHTRRVLVDASTTPTVSEAS
jgi:hypothetical protein